MKEIDMIERSASSSLGKLEKAVLLGLYENYKSGKPSKIAEIYEWLGIERIIFNGEYDQLIHGVLVRLRNKGSALHKADIGAVYACEDGEWEITREGISVIRAINAPQDMFEAGLKEFKRLVLCVLDGAKGPVKTLEIYEQLRIKKLTREDDDTQHDNLIKGVLFFLREEGRVLHVPYNGWQVQRKE